MDNSSQSQHPLLQLLKYSKKYRIKIILATLFSILNKWFDLAPPFLIGAAVDIVVRKENSIFGSLGIRNTTNQLIFLALLTLIIWILESVFEYSYKIYWRNLAQTIEHELRMDTYSHLQHLELEFFENNRSGGLMAIINNDVNQLERFLDIGANDLIQVTVTAITISIAFFILAPTIAWMAIFPMPFILYFSIKYQHFLESKYSNVREKVGVLNSQLSNNLNGIATIKSFTTEDFEVDRIGYSSNDYLLANRDAIKYSSAFSPLIRMIIVIGFTLMLFYGGLQVINEFLEVAVYSTMIFLTQRLLWPLTRLGETFDQYQRAMASTKRIMNLLATSSKIVSGPIQLKTSDIKGKIEFKDITFSYKSRNILFNHFNVTISPGQTVAFVGVTGAGKSTLIKLLLRFYDPDSGSILVDDQNIIEYNLQDYRKGIGLVLQDTFLIDGTVRENIAYGHPETALEDIINAAKIAEIHDFIKSLPDNYDTLVGERGQKLSVGQRQRISIARAVLKNPPILVFDEATSSVDNETEAAIQKSLDKLIIGRTTIIIAHRLSTIRNADQIFVLENGVIIEHGTHEELLAIQGQYDQLWKVQTGERISPMILK